MSYAEWAVARMMELQADGMIPAKLRAPCAAIYQALILKALAAEEWRWPAVVRIRQEALAEELGMSARGMRNYMRPLTERKYVIQRRGWFELPARGAVNGVISAYGAVNADPISARSAVNGAIPARGAVNEDSLSAQDANNEGAYIGSPSLHTNILPEDDPDLKLIEAELRSLGEAGEPLLAKMEDGTRRIDRMLMTWRRDYPGINYAGDVRAAVNWWREKPPKKRGDFMVFLGRWIERTFRGQGLFKPGGSKKGGPATQRLRRDERDGADAEQGAGMKYPRLGSEKG